MLPIDPAIASDGVTCEIVPYSKRCFPRSKPDNRVITGSFFLVVSARAKYQMTGKVTLKIQPPPGVSSSNTLPLNLSTILETVANPIPVPWLEPAVEPRTKTSKTDLRS